MASLSNINGLFDVHSTGAILFSTSHGTSGQILRSNGNAAPTWVAASTVIGGPYLPLTGGTLTGATATASGISFTVGGALTGTTAGFSGSVIASGNSNSFGNTTIAALSASTGTFSASVTAAGNSNSFGATTFSGQVNINSGSDLRLYRSDNATYARFNYAGGSVGLDIDDLNSDGINLQQAGVNKLRIETNGNATFTDSITAASASIPTMSVNTNFLGSIFQYGSTFRTSSFINLLNNRNTKKYLETAYFTNGVSNQAVNIQFINASHQGFYKITLSGSYSHQDISGKLTKVIPFGYNPNGSIWRTGNNQSEITIATGGVSTNFTIGNLAWDSTNSKFIIPIYKLTNTGNAVKILVEYLGGAANNLKDVTLSSNYTQAAPSPFNVRQYRNIRDRLGIGTNTPATKLEVNGGLIKVVDSGDTAFYGGDYVRVFGTQSYGFRNSAGSSIAQISLTGNSYFNGGNVGIGTTSPQRPLHVDGTEGVARFTSTASGNNGFEVGIGTASQAFLWQSESQFMQFATANTERMRITSAGELYIGHTSTNPANGLTVVDPSTGTYIQLDHINGTASGSIFSLFRYNQSVIGSITQNGTSQVSFNISSDYRLKEDLQDFAGLDMVSKIPVYDFKWKTDESRSYGVMAHELQEVLPDAVVGKKDAEEMQGVDYSKIVPLLVKSIQELETRIKELENK